MGISLHFTAGFSVKPQVLRYKSARDVEYGLSRWPVSLLPLLFHIIILLVDDHYELFSIDCVTENRQGAGSVARNL